MIYLLTVLGIFSQITGITTNQTYEIEIVTRKMDTYTVLTKGQPVTITVDGPTYLRVYTRIPWTDRTQRGVLYKIILQENELEERIITFESEMSSVSKNTQGKPVSKWRSFYIEVPQGSNTYKITHWLSPSDTILLKFTHESPKKWRDIPATEYNTVIEAAEDERIIRYYELEHDATIALRIKGPTKLMVITRLNYDETMFGEQSYSLLAEDGATTERFQLKCHKSETVTYTDRQELIPSNIKRSYIDVSDGWHTIQFTLSGTTAQSVSVRFQVEE